MKLNVNNPLIFKVFLAGLLISLSSFLPFQAISPSYSSESSSRSNSSSIFSRKKQPGGGRNWEEIEVVFLNIRRQKKSGGSRSSASSLCLVSPTVLVNGNSSFSRNTEENTIEIWNHQPRFIWQAHDGMGKEIILASEQNPDTIWSKEISAEQESILYDGKPLQPGQSYYWYLQTELPFPQQTANISFKIISGSKREEISQALKEIDQTLQGQPPERIALEKANYFISQKLWSDALQEIFAVSNPSAKLQQTLETIGSHDFCES